MAESKKKTTTASRKSAQKGTEPPAIQSASLPLQPIKRTAYSGADTKGGVLPQAVVKVYSSRGLEYLFMVISLVLLTIGILLLGTDIINYIFGGDEVTGGFGEWAGIEALTLVGAVAFFYLWSRLRAAEAVSPAVLRDGSRKRALQKGLIVGFVGLLAAGVGFAYTVLDILASGSELSSGQWQSLLSAGYVLAVVAGVFNFLLNQERKGE